MSVDESAFVRETVIVAGSAPVLESTTNVMTIGSAAGRVSPPRSMSTSLPRIAYPLGASITGARRSMETAVGEPLGAVNATVVWIGTAAEAPTPPGSVVTVAG